MLPERHSGPRFTAIYSLLNPPSGQAGTIIITLDDAVSNGIVAGAATFSGVNPAVPLGTPLGAHATATDTPGPTLTFSSLSGNELVFDNVFLGGADDSYDLTVGADQTLLWNDFNTNARGAASIEQAASPVTMSWNQTNTANWWAQVGVPINPALGGVTYYDLTVAVDPTGAGTTNPAVGIHTYQENAVVDITASPASGFVFDEWSGACSGSGACQVTMNSNMSVTANFNPITIPITFTGEELLGRPTDDSISIKIVPDEAITYYYEYGTTSGVYGTQTSNTPQLPEILRRLSLQDLLRTPSTSTGCNTARMVVVRGSQDRNSHSRHNALREAHLHSISRPIPMSIFCLGTHRHGQIL